MIYKLSHTILKACCELQPVPSGEALNQGVALQRKSKLVKIDIKNRILCVHQGGELYGSDRSFLQAVEIIRQTYPDAHLKVLLASDGPLATHLHEFADELVVRDLLVLRMSILLKTVLKLTVGLPYYLLRCWWDCRSVDLIYVNTSVIADFMMLSRLSPNRFILHVREIPKPAVLPFIRFLCRLSRSRIIFNSHATAKAFDLPIDQLQEIIHNGSDEVIAAAPPKSPLQFSNDRPLRISMLGRINSWKGQDLLVDALALMPLLIRNQLQVRIVGSAYGRGGEQEQVLSRRIQEADLSDVVSLEAFRDDTSTVYAWSDICIVPSRLPEPFGRVAIESMAYGRAVIVAAHGGLIEIVVDEISGWHFTPNDEKALASKILGILDEPSLISEVGCRALERFQEHFSTEAMSKKLKIVLETWLPHLATVPTTEGIKQG